jgi:ATP-binding cassette subfamily B protein
MVAKYYGRAFTLQELRDLSGIGREGVSLLGISEAAQSIGFRTVAARLSLPQLLKMPLPAIVHWQENHFVVVAPKPPKGAFNTIFIAPPSGAGGAVLIADPSTGLQTLSQQEFIEGWLGNNAQEGIALLLEPTQQFYKEEDSILATDTSLSKSPHRGLGGWPLILGYLWQHRRLVIQLFVGLLVGSLLQLVFPFLTQSVIDIGVNTRQPSFIMLVLVAQLALTLGRTSVEFIRSWLLMYISSRLNLSLLSDFLLKLTKLPMSFFDRGGGPRQAIWRHYATYFRPSPHRTIFDQPNALNGFCDVQSQRRTVF